MGNSFKTGDMLLDEFRKLNAKLQGLQNNLEHVAAFAGVKVDPQTFRVDTDPDLSNFVRALNEDYERQVEVKRHVAPGIGLSLPGAIEKITAGDDVLIEDTASITVEVPSEYKHLFVIGAGRNTVTGAGVGARGVWCQFNGDTGANYSGQYVSGNQATATAAENLLHSDGVHLGTIPENDAGAGKAGHFFTFIPHCHSAVFFKAALALEGYPLQTHYTSRYQYETWLSLEPISTMYLYCSSGSFLAGDVIGVYGIR